MCCASFCIHVLFTSEQFTFFYSLFFLYIKIPLCDTVSMCNIFLFFGIVPFSILIWLFIWASFGLILSLYACVSEFCADDSSFSGFAPVTYWNYMQCVYVCCITNRINDKMINGFWYFLSFCVLIYINDIAKPLWFHKHYAITRRTFYCDMHLTLREIGFISLFSH